MIIVDEVRISLSLLFFLRECFVLFLNFCAKDATLELRVRTVKYFKDMWQVFETLTKN